MREKNAYTIRDMIFTMLRVFNNGGTWNFLGAIFEIKTSTFQKLISKLLGIFSERSYDTLEVAQFKKLTIEFLMENNVSFKYFKEARYATDLIFQQSSRPMGTIPEIKNYFSEEHHLYG